MNCLPFPKTNTDSLETLLTQFFEHYSQFNFSTMAICLNEPSQVHKPDHSPLYIVNPLERGLNVSKNVSVDELQKLKVEMRNAAWVLESTESKTWNWGVLSLLDGKKTINGKYTKLIEVSSLFAEESEELPEELENDEVKRQVTKIKKETSESINKVSRKLNNRRNSERGGKE